MARNTVKNAGVTIISLDENCYISLTDIDKYENDNLTAVVGNRMCNCRQ